MIKKIIIGIILVILGCFLCIAGVIIDQAWVIGILGALILSVGVISIIYSRKINNRFNASYSFLFGFIVVYMCFVRPSVSKIIWSEGGLFYPKNISQTLDENGFLTIRWDIVSFATSYNLIIYRFGNEYLKETEIMTRPFRMQKIGFQTSDLLKVIEYETNSPYLTTEFENFPTYRRYVLRHYNPPPFTSIFDNRIQVDGHYRVELKSFFLSMLIGRKSFLLIDDR